jgi:hypothetical protein
MQSGKSFGRASVVRRTEPSATPKDDFTFVPRGVKPYFGEAIVRGTDSCVKPQI